MLDTGDELKVETLKGDEIKKRGLDPGEPVQPDDRSRRHLVSGGATRVSRRACGSRRPTPMLAATSSTATRLVWDRAFGRPRNTVVLPAGWTVVASSIPATISEDRRRPPAPVLRECAARRDSNPDSSSTEFAEIENGYHRYAETEEKGTVPVLAETETPCATSSSSWQFSAPVARAATGGAVARTLHR